ncbi:DUF2905 domain-containing protein [bacterium]|nr:DUF2905 domain-containing protein [bacterium]
MDLSTLGKWIFYGGLGMATIGLLVWLAGRSGLPLGNLPGDIRIEREGGSFYFPIVTMIVISIVLSLLLNLIIRLFSK